ncbi:hypothetical protein CN918_27540 [Priestia megaterium]|nr:hypothetical protein CN918_27540 [Priestia megaterium]
MKDLLNNRRAMTIVLIICFVVVLPVVFFLGFRYLAPVLIIALAYLYIHLFKYEEIISPKEFTEMRDYLRDLEERKEIIQEHLEKHDGDLDAKFELREILKEMEEIKKQMGL